MGRPPKPKPTDQQPKFQCTQQELLLAKKLHKISWIGFMEWNELKPETKIEFILEARNNLLKEYVP